MPNVSSMRLEGGEELLDALNRMDVSVKGELRGAALAGAEIVAEVAKSMAPGPEIEAQVSQASALLVMVDVGPDAEHWFYRFYETGAAAHEIQGAALLVFEGREGTVVTPHVSHPGMAAQPFLRPAFDESQDSARDTMGARLRSRIEEVRG